jgi:hypothetical protein
VSPKKAETETQISQNIRAELLAIMQDTRRVPQMTTAPGEITQLLQRVRQGDSQAPGELWAHLYPELHHLA